jgi:hypothetical protein
MTSYYCLFQYAHDIAGDERVTFGVITYDSDGICTRFLEDWSRIRAFALKDIDFLDEFALRTTYVPPTLEDVRFWVRNWHNSLRLTEPRASLLSKEELLDRIAEKALTEPTKQGFQISVTPSPL